MRILTLLLLFLAPAVFGQNYAVVAYRGDTNGIPDGWPKLVRPLGKAEGPLAEGEELKTEDELADIRKSLQPVMDAREAAEVATARTIERSREEIVRDARKEMMAMLAVWDAMTVTQQKAVLKRVIQFLLNMP